MLAVGRSLLRTSLAQPRLLATAASATGSTAGGAGRSGGGGGGWNVRPVKPAAGSGGSGGSERGRTMGIAFFGGVTAYGAYLGLWQMGRYNDKNDLIEARRCKINETPVDLPIGLSGSSERALIAPFEHRRVRVRGRFELHNDGNPAAVYISPRSAPAGSMVDEGVPEAVRSSMAAGATGALVLAPFRRSDDGTRLLVHRGWVPKEVEVERLERRAAAAAAGEDGDQLLLGEEEVLVGVLSAGEKGGPFSPENKVADLSRGHAFWVELPKIAPALGFERPVHSETAGGAGVTGAVGLDEDEGPTGMMALVPAFLRPSASSVNGAKKKKSDGASAPWAADYSGWTGLPLLLAEVDMSGEPEAADSGAGDVELTSKERLAANLPIAKRSAQFLEFYVTPFKHATYAGTWFALSACCAILTYARFFRGPAVRARHAAAAAARAAASRKSNPTA